MIAKRAPDLCVYLYITRLTANAVRKILKLRRRVCCIVVIGQFVNGENVTDKRRNKTTFSNPFRVYLSKATFPIPYEFKSENNCRLSVCLICSVSRLVSSVRNVCGKER